MQDISEIITDEERTNAQMQRERATNPPAFEPGMGDDSEMNDFDDFSSGDSSDMDSFSMGGGSDFGSPGGFDSGFGGMGMGGFGGMGAPQQSNSSNSSEEKFFEVVKAFFTGFKDWSKNFIVSFKKFDIRKKVETGKIMFIASLSMIGVGLLLAFFTKSLGVELMVGGLLATAFSAVFFMSFYGKAQELGIDLSAPVVPEQPPLSANDDLFSMADNDESDDFYTDDDEDEDELDTGEEVFDDNSDDNFDYSSIALTETKSANPEDILNSVDIDRGMVTRQYLFELMERILPSCDDTYDKEKIEEPGSTTFNSWDAIIKQAAEIFRSNQEDSPNLLEFKDKLFYYQLTVSRVKWIKNIDTLVQELVNICKYDKNGGQDDRVYGTGVYVGNKAIIKIYKGSTAMVSVADAYRQVKDEILNTKNIMPVVLGIDSEGKVIVQDLSKIFALCVSGMPRSGKTWFVQAVLTQMMMYLKPSELQFLIYDPKDNMSDFKAMTMPHIKDFRAKDEDIVAGLKWVVKVEAERRDQIIGGAGFVNIEDYKKANPLSDMPYLYVVIDEVITFATRMKDEKPDLYKEFQSYLKELVSRLPGMGIRLFMIPHVLKNDIISKTTTDLIPCRISVKGSPDHIESITGAKPKDFPYALTHHGDMAVRLDGYTNFCHAAILSGDNATNNQLFSFLTQLWLKIEPESIKGSVYEKSQRGNSVVAQQGETGVNTSTTQNASVSQNTPKSTNSKLRKRADISFAPNDDLFENNTSSSTSSSTSNFGEEPQFDSTTNDDFWSSIDNSDDNW